MLINENTAISTTKILLVPYSDYHVVTYHEWLQDSDIQQATASEPLTLSEEYSMQQSWQADGDKLTFISCLPADQDDLRPQQDDAPHRMLGDVNMFLTEDKDDEASIDGLPGIVGEIELMIAEKQHQGHGYGRATMIAFLRYIADHEEEIMQEYLDGSLLSKSFKFLRVKISELNLRSIALFETVGFVRYGAPNYFREIELRLRGDLKSHARVLLERYSSKNYRESDYKSPLSQENQNFAA